MKQGRGLITVLIAVCLCGVLYSQPYEPNWESLNKRPTPGWFSDARFGIFIHWGVYSVPAWGQKQKYAEWYWNSLNVEGSPTQQFHDRVYGRDFTYYQFKNMFTAELFDPDQWADLFVKSGARYIVLTSKHHDGYCLWPSKQANASWGQTWNALDTRPKRDLMGDLTAAVKKRGRLKMGFYYSLYEWYNPLYNADVDAYVKHHMIPQMKELITRYEPAVFWTDGEWSHPSETWRSTEFLAWLYNESSVRDYVAVNDRWGSECRHVNGGYYTTEYGAGVEGGHPWEECRGMGHSFGYNRFETIDEYRSALNMIHVLADIVSKGGNLLLDIGPTADGRIPVIMQERLLEIGKWLDVNGEAIYSTRPWKIDGISKTFTYTEKGSVVDRDWHRGSPHSDISVDNFQGLWTGFIRPRYSEEYTFELTADTRGGLWIDGKLVIDDLKEYRKWGGTGSCRLWLEAGRKYPIQVKLVEEDRNASIVLSWSSKSQEKEVVPAQCLFASEDIPEGGGLNVTYSSEGKTGCYTTKGDSIYLIMLRWPSEQYFAVDVPAPSTVSSQTAIQLLGTDIKVPWGYKNDKVYIDLSGITYDQLPCDHAYTFKFTGFGN